ncbi:hypothetical protein DEA8626_02581 [Defluviimonas aquaemixtae]|uniref:Aminoglycoside phosphotransferase domain-containing protein n=1 Tax=Albidovulum aquaemixtae TaxID=1542388 RepID=A0A2R8BJJ1_9RHOB|nr:phosphotransferase [Defluviimonas aquaemixtae]SPH23517.1 hypothetical protein DEA8626_02581 [Defluviimonas aquaemixtae]
MTEVTERCAAFLSHAGWGCAERQALAGDASTRRYERLVQNGESAVLMIAPPDSGASTRDFARMATWLRERCYSPPALLAEDHVYGLLLLEDLGDALIARLIEDDPRRQPQFYSAATDFLSDLRRHSTPEFVKPLDGAALGALVALVPRWYLPGVGEAQNSAANALPEVVEAEYERISTGPLITSLRDFHSENLIWLPDRTGLARLGLLDFQDAVAAHPAYDLVSLLQDARRDVPEEIELNMVGRYVEANGEDPERFGAIYSLLGAQRALRIIGIFARLSLHRGKPRYLAHIPRVWRYLMRNLAHKSLERLAAAVSEGLPEPTPERIRRIEDQCGKHPTP